MMRQVFSGECDRCAAAYHGEFAPVLNNWAEMNMVYLDEDTDKAAQRQVVLCSTCVQGFIGWWKLKGETFYV